MNPHTKSIVSKLVLLAILLIIVVGVYALGTKKVVAPAVENAVATTSTTTQFANPDMGAGRGGNCPVGQEYSLDGSSCVPTSTSGWKMYANTQSGYQVSYPADWQVISKTGIVTASNSISIYNPSKSSQGNLKEGISIYVLNPGSPCVESTWDSGASTPAYAVACISSGKERIEMDFVAYDKQAEATEEKMESTFKFTN